MALAQMQGEGPPVLDLDARAGCPGPARASRCSRPAGRSRRPPSGGYPWRGRPACAARRRACRPTCRPRRTPPQTARRADRRWPAGAGRPKANSAIAAEDRAKQRCGVAWASASGLIRTKWWSSRSTRRVGPLPNVNGAGQAVGSEVLPAISAEKSRGCEGRARAPRRAAPWCRDGPAGRTAARSARPRRSARRTSRRSAGRCI